MRDLTDPDSPRRVHRQELKEFGFPPELSRQMKVLVNPSPQRAAAGRTSHTHEQARAELEGPDAEGYQGGDRPWHPRQTLQIRRRQL
jgi:hypothetical protein